MNMRPRFARTKALVIAAGLTLGVLGTTGAASASAPNPKCPFTNTVCLFDGENYAGERLTVSSLGSSACVDLVAHGWGARAKSAINTGSRTAAMFQLHTDCLGHGAPIHPGETPNFSGWFSPVSIQVY
ncbi:peptidase inhibitor family I36 protein [Nonomuraea longicatena]|uniref:Peptidase inhibitor family I36 n=1 Tax=Nonomuraea longicatena TaxID=83682 RepID=A0ABN1RAY2_9ACTN